MSEQYPLNWTFDLEVNYATILGFLDSYAPCALDFVIIEETDSNDQHYYRWSSPHLNELTNMSQVRSRAAALKALYDGAMLIHTNGAHIIRPSCGPQEGNGSAALNFSQPCEPYGSNWKQWRYELHANPRRHFVSASLFHARYDEATKRILISLGTNDANWSSLYTTLESLKQKGCTEAQLADGVGRSKSDFDRFRATANNHAAIGPAARHAEQGWVPPKAPMDLIEAQTLIFTSFRYVINSQASQIEANFRAAAKL